MLPSKLFSATNKLVKAPKFKVAKNFTSIKPPLEEGQDPPKDLTQDTIFGKIIRVS